MSEILGWKFRLAEPADAEAFTQWTLSNPQIDPKDIEAAKKENNPTVIYFAAENAEGQVVAFAPVYLQMILAHLVFNPDAAGKDKLRAMQFLLNGAVLVAIQHGVREIVTLSKENYPVAKWAVKHGFDLEPRQLFKFDINRVLDAPEEDKTCAVQADK
jgi:hypothetical protein